MVFNFDGNERNDDNIISNKKNNYEQILKFEELVKEIQCKWNVKTKVTSKNRGNCNHLKIT
jgi:hypothetical protein